MSQEIKTPKNKIPFKLPLRVWLGYLLILSLVFTAVSFAKFATSGSASDSARVASFAVSASTGGEKSLTFDDSAKNASGESFSTTQTASYDVTVRNTDNNKVSEVVIGYDVIVKVLKSKVTGTDGDIQSNSGLTFKLGESTAPVITTSGDYYVFTFSDVGVLPAGVSTEETHKLTITADSDKIQDDFSNIEFSVSVNFEQID